MVNLADITRESGQGAGLAALSRLYGLDQTQTNRAIEAVLPAFTLAFQRLALNPVAFGELLKAVGSGSYAPFFDNPGQSQAAASGAAVLNQLFRSPEGAQQVAAKAAALTGVGMQVMQQMMPVLAATIVGGMFRTASVEGFADLLRQWGDALRTAGETLNPPKPQDPWSVWQEAAGRMMGLRPSAPPKPAAPEPTTVLDAWVAMVGAMTGAMPGAALAAAPAPTPEVSTLRPAIPPLPEPSFDDDEAEEAVPHDRVPDAPPNETGSGVEPNPFEAVSQMFETGREVHAQHVAAFQSILDNVWGTGRKA